jgi:hypothetical protein
MTDFWSSLNAPVAALGGWMTDFPATLDDQSGLLAPAIGGATAAIAVGLAVAIYLGSGYRSSRDMVRDGVATVMILGTLALVVHDIRQAAADRLGISPAKPAVQLDIQRPTATV